MSSSLLLIMQEEINSIDKRREYTISILGCGQTGIIHSLLFADAGFKVICADADQATVNSLSRGKTPFLRQELESKLKNHVKTGLLGATSDIKSAVSQGRIIVIATPVEMDEKRKPDYSNIEKTCKLAGSSLRPGSLVIIVSTTGLGIVESVLKKVLENTSGLKVGTDLGLAYSPMPMCYGRTLETKPSFERIVAAADRGSLDAASIVLGAISEGRIRKTNNIRIAEATALLQPTIQAARIALANELALFCEKAGIDYLEAQRLAGTESPCMLPSPSLANCDSQHERYLLLEEAENSNAKLRIVSVTMEANEEIARHAANLVKDALRDCGKALRRARISVLGVSQLPNERSLPKKTIKELIRILETKGAKIGLYDPYFSENDLPEMQRHLKKTLSEVIEGADCIMIVTGHDQFKHLSLKKLRVTMKMPAAIVDLENALEPEKVESEGFRYRGLGRGGQTK